MDDTVQIPLALLSRAADYLDSRLDREYFDVETMEEKIEIQAIVDSRFTREGANFPVVQELRFLERALGFLSKHEVT